MRFKRKSIILIIFILLLTGCAKDLIKEEATPIVTETKHEYTLQETMEILVSDEFKGRLTGTEGNEKATSYIDNRFKEMDLIPYRGDSYLQSYNQKIFHPDEQKYSLTIEYEDGTEEELRLGIDYLYKNVFYNKDVSLSITSDINDKDISKKMILLRDDKDLPTALEKAGGLLIPRDEFVVSPLMGSSNVPIIDITRKTNEKIESKGGKIIKIESEFKGENMLVYNVAGKIPGKNDKKALVLSAHFDHVGWRGNAVFPGAIDNASGTVVLLDVAKRLKEYSDINPFEMDILIVAFNGEESGLVGSQDFVKRIKNSYDDIYNINIDCVGSKSGGKIAFDDEIHIAKDLIEELKKCLERNNIEYEDKYYGGSDHLSFIDYNIPAITIGQGYIQSIIHRESDTIEEVDFEYLQRISDSIYDFVLDNDGRSFNP